jgi:hypothetical protein
MKKDRAAIAEIISHMLDNPGPDEIYPTSTAYRRLEQYVEEQRVQALGWAYTDSCIMLDNGDDPRLSEVPDIIARAAYDLEDER